jgi:hypothetical protein
MLTEMPEYNRTRIPFLKAWAIFIWSFFIPVTLAVLMIAFSGLMILLLSYGTTMSELLWGAVCLICALGFGFLFQWQQAIEAKRPEADTPITKSRIMTAGKETYSRMKTLILRHMPGEE